MGMRTIGVALSLLPGLIAAPAHARQAESEPAGAFCALAGLDLLAALDGAWTIHQGAGQARAGIMNVPIPAPPPARVTFHYDPQKRVIDVRSADLAEGMVMFPTAPIQQAQAADFVGDPPDGTATAPVCAWLEAPTVIGTNVYIAYDEINWAKLDPKKPSACAHTEAKLADPNATYPGSPKEDYESFAETYCQDPGKPVLEAGTEFDMEMTLVVRFTSANSGAGMLYFEGETNRSKFRASAPVRLTR